MRIPLLVSALVALFPALQPAAAQDAASGAKLFAQRCQACHSLEPGGAARVGPNLSVVFGGAAAAKDFPYSPALARSGLVWDAATLDAYLAAPAKTVRGTKMTVGVPDATQRADIIAFLKTLAE